MASPWPCRERLARAIGGDVSLAFFHGCPFNPDERAICENWTFTVPQRSFGVPRFDDAIDQLAGSWRAVGYHNEHPVYVHDDVESAVYYNEYKEQWEVISIADEAIDLLARAKKKKGDGEAPPRNGWIVACIGDDMITAGVRFDIVQELQEKAFVCKDAQEDQAHFDDTERPPKRQRESLWQREAEEPRLPASAQSFQEPRLSASAQSFQDWGALAARAKHGPPPSRPPIGLHPSKGLFDALNLEQAQPTLPRGKRWSLASLAEFEQAMFPSRRSKDCKLESPDGKNDSGPSVASSFAARRFWESVCQCGSAVPMELRPRPRCSVWPCIRRASALYVGSCERGFCRYHLMECQVCGTFPLCMECVYPEEHNCIE